MLLGLSLLALLSRKWQAHPCSTSPKSSRGKPPKDWDSASPCLAGGPASGQRARQQLHLWSRCQILHRPWQCAPIQQGMLLVRPASGSCWTPMQSLGSQEHSPCLVPGIWQQAQPQTQQTASGTALTAPLTPLGMQQPRPGWGRQGRGRHHPSRMELEGGQECHRRSSSCPGSPCLQGWSKPPSNQGRFLLVIYRQSSTPADKEVCGNASQAQLQACI